MGEDYNVHKYIPKGGCRQMVKFNKRQYTTVLSISKMEGGRCKDAVQY